MGKSGPSFNDDTCVSDGAIRSLLDLWVRIPDPGTPWGPLIDYEHIDDAYRC